MATKGTDIRFNFVGDASRFNNAANKVNKGLKGLGNSIKASFSPANMLGPLAAAASFQALSRALVDASKVYFEDQKSMALLNKVIDNNTNATLAQKTAIDENVQSMSMMSATSDDDLRQALSNLVVGTKDTTKAQQLLSLALDTSKGSGKDLNTVSLALSKAYNGNYTSLKKLLPGVTASSAAFGELEAAYAGAAATAGANDPFGQLAIAAEQIQEAIGEEIAPYIQDFVKWFNSPEGQESVDATVKAFKDLMAGIKPFADFMGSPAMSWAIESFGGGFIGMIGKIANATSGVSKESKELNDRAKELGLAMRQTGKDLLKGDDIPQGPLPIAERIKNAAKEIKTAGDKWKNSLSLAGDLSEDKKFFNAENFMRKMRDIVAAAKALPAKLKALRAAGASPEMLQQVIAMGPQEGLAVAEGFIRTGGAKEYSKSLQTLSSLGQKSQANIAGQKTYTINVNKANMTADEIIAAIQKYESKTGRKVAFGG